MDFAKLAAERYSLRKFSDRPVEAEKLSAVSGELDEHGVEVFYRVLRAIVERIEDI